MHLKRDTIRQEESSQVYCTGPKKNRTDNKSYIIIS